MDETAETTVVVLVTQAKGPPGQWVAHCLNIDVMTQGESVQHAFMMAQEALVQVIVDDLANGLNPLERPEAPEECWDIVSRTLRRGRPLNTIDDPKKITAAIGYLRVVVPIDALPEHARPELPEVDMLPAPWQIAAVQNFHDSAQC